MIKIENTEVVGVQAAIRGMRNPMNSWDKSDSSFITSLDKNGSYFDSEDYFINDDDHYWRRSSKALLYHIGDNDLDLMKRLAAAGTDHSKYRRMITVYADIIAPLYFWKEYDTYKVGTVANSCSTMHKIHEKEFTKEDFSYENVMPDVDTCDYILVKLNYARDKFLETKDKRYWYSMIQMLPSSYNQKRTVMLNYEVLANQYKSRKNHKLDEWHDYCKWIEGLPYSEIITA